jgi:hypothetical protein
MYITTIDKNEDIFRVTAVFSFLKTICDYEHFLPLNTPVATDTVDSVIDLPAKFEYVSTPLPSPPLPSPPLTLILWPFYRQKHFLIGILLREVDNCFKKAVAARTQVGGVVWCHGMGSIRKGREGKGSDRLRTCER